MNMNEQARVSIDAIRRQIPGNADTQWVMVFGSQARGDQRPDSDLDVLHIVNRWCGKYNAVHYDVIRDIVRATPGGVRDVTVLVETPLTIQKYGNLYGSTEYNALREGRVVYGAEGAQHVHTYEMPAAEAARRWLSRAYMQVLYGRQMKQEADRGAMWRMSVEYSLKSALCSRGVRFPFVRDDPRRLYEMLPDGDTLALGGGKLENPGERDAERVYGSVRAFLGEGVPESFAIDDGPWTASDILTCIADLESLRGVTADRMRDVLDERIDILRRRHGLLAEIADGVTVEAAAAAATAGADGKGGRAAGG